MTNTDRAAGLKDTGMVTMMATIMVVMDTDAAHLMVVAMEEVVMATVTMAIVIVMYVSLHYR